MDKTIKKQDFIGCSIYTRFSWGSKVQVFKKVKKFLKFLQQN